MAIRIKKHSALKTQCFVIKALLKRELVTKFGKYKLGALWMLIDPLVSVIVLGVILGPFLGRSSGDIPYSFFLLCGFMLLTLFTAPVNSSAEAIRSNQGLLVFKEVQPFDAFMSRYIFVFLSTVLAFAFFCFVSVWIGIELSGQNVFLLLYCLIITWLSGCGLGLIMGIASVKVRELDKVIMYFQRPLIFLSAVLYPIEAIPTGVREYLLWNPLVHTIEYARSCLFPNYTVHLVNLIYPSIFALSCLAFGMVMYRNNRHFLTQR